MRALTIQEAGGTPIEFNTVMVTDGIAMGSEGMSASLMSRETITDSIELFQSGLSSFQMVLTYICMALIPFAVMGLYVIDSRKGGPVYLIGAFLIAVSYVYFSGTAAYVLAEKMKDYGLLVEKLGFMYRLHGVILVVGGICFGIALLRSRLSHPIIAYGILAGSLISLVTGVFHLSEQLFIVGNYLRNIAFVSLGIQKLTAK